VGSRAGLDGCGKSPPLSGIRSSDRPARSESLYRLGYPQAPSRVTTAERAPETNLTGNWMGPNTEHGPVWVGAENLPPLTGFDPRNVQPVASRYIDYASPTHYDDV
jgi:hypothetical protein